MSRRKIISIVVLLLCMGTIQLTADTIIDSVYADPVLDGYIKFSQNNQNYTVNTLVDIYVGDVGIAQVPPYDPNSRMRGYVSFVLPQIPDGYEVDSAYFRLYQLHSYGNDFQGFPIWDVSCGDTMFCIMDHIDYGNYLDPSDWTKGDPGDPGTLHTNIGIISDSAEVGYRYLDITDYVLDDYTSNRDKSQYRIRFPIETDWDYRTDYLDFVTSNYTENYRPLIVLYFTSNNSIGDTTFPVTKNILLYPNPIEDELMIKFYMFKQKEVEISLYNVKGQKIKDIFSGSIRSDENMLEIDMKSISNGIYFIKVDEKDSNPIVKKIIILN